MDRTLVLNLQATPEQARILYRTISEHTMCLNEVVQTGFTEKCSNGVELHKQTYYPLRAQYPDLPAQLVCAARVKATETVKSALTWQKKQEQDYPKKVAKALKKGKPIPVFKPVTCPCVKHCPIRYDVRSYWVSGRVLPVASQRSQDGLQSLSLFPSMHTSTSVTKPVVLICATAMGSGPPSSGLSSQPLVG